MQNTAENVIFKGIVNIIIIEGNPTQCFWCPEQIRNIKTFENKMFCYIGTDRSWISLTSQSFIMFWDVVILLIISTYLAEKVHANACVM